MSHINNCNGIMINQSSIPIHMLKTQILDKTRRRRANKNTWKSSRWTYIL